jgi:uncharacterized membrane protein YidH (DUF202 family)
MLWHCLYTLIESVVRITAPLLLRRFLQLLEEADQTGDENEKDTKRITEQLWLFACLISCTTIVLGLAHHQVFWIGMRLGFNLRTQMMAAIHAKVRVTEMMADNENIWCACDK